jgi:pyrroloquinoline quinone biosynthesis protein B
MPCGPVIVGIEAIVLGSAQDGGLPQVGCGCTNCCAAWDDPCRVRLVACLGLVDSTTGEAWLVDATPDLPEQWHRLRELYPGCRLAGILLTHAHMGHYTGLLHLGREAWNRRDVPLFATGRMSRFLSGNAPWSRLIAQGNVRISELLAGHERRLSTDLAVTPLAVPHRDELSDTVGFLIAGTRRQLFYCPDVDSWDGWDIGLRSLVAGMDVALLDGTFFSDEELPDRDMSQIPHPLAVDTAELLAGVSCDVRLVHLNHSNPLSNAGPEREWLAACGIGVAALGDRWEL